MAGGGYQKTGMARFHPYSRYRLGNRPDEGPIETWLLIATVREQNAAEIAALAEIEQPNRHSLDKNPVREEIAFYYDDAVQVLDLATLESRRLTACPEGYAGNLAGFTADDRSVITAFTQDLSDRFQVDLLNGYIGSYAMRAAMQSGHADQSALAAP